MNTTNRTSAATAAGTTPARQEAMHRAVIGGGVITAPAVAAHLRKSASGSGDRKAVIGGGVIAPPALNAHLRGKPARTSENEQPPATRKAVVGGGVIGAPAVSVHLRRKMSARA